MPATSPGRVRLIVLNYNSGAFLPRCFAALHALDWPADELELVLVDNASTDGSTEAIEATHPDVRIIRNPTNTGFPANNLGLADLDGVRCVGLVNSDGFVEPGWLRALVDALDGDPSLGAAAAKMLFDPTFVDVVIDSPTFVPGVGDSRDLGVRVSGLRVAGIDRWDDAQFGEGAWGVEQGRDSTFQWTSAHAVLRVPVGPAAAASQIEHQIEIRFEAESTKKITITSGAHTSTVEVGEVPQWVTVAIDGEPYDVIQNAGSMIFEDGSGADRGFCEADIGQFDDADEVFAWCGGSVLFRPSYVRECGAFDERFFLYYEDTDWAWRGRAQGWRYGYVPGAVMRHLHAASTGEGSPVFAYHVERNRLLMLVKNAPARLALQQVIRYVLVTASYARRDIVGPLTRRKRPNTVTVRRRVTSFLGFLRLLPAMLVSRRGLRRRQSVPDEQLLAWFVKRQPS